MTGRMEDTMTTTQQAPDLNLPTNVPVHTEYGNVLLTVGDANTITITAGFGSPPVKIHAKDYSVTIVLRRANGKWDLAPAPQGMSRGANAFIKSVGAVVQDAPTTYRSKILSAIVQAVNTWVQSNYQFVDMAEYVATQKELIRVEAEIEQVQKQLQEKVEASQALRARMAACSYQPNRQEAAPRQQVTEQSGPATVQPAA